MASLLLTIFFAATTALSGYAATDYCAPAEQTTLREKAENMGKRGRALEGGKLLEGLRAVCGDRLEPSAQAPSADWEAYLQFVVVEVELAQAAHLQALCRSRAATLRQASDRAPKMPQSLVEKVVRLRDACPEVPKRGT